MILTFFEKIKSPDLKMDAKLNSKTHLLCVFGRLPTPPRAAVENVQKSDFSPEKADKSLNFFNIQVQKRML
jgi:hypothetical protein